MEQATAITKNTVKPTLKAQAIVKAKRDNPTLTTREIGKLTDCDHSHVVRVLSRYGIESKEVQDYKDHRADIFSGIQNKILKSVTEEDIQKASLQVKAMAFGVLYDKERLERGQSTENVSIISRLANDLKKFINANDND
jgi:hypothetical protein